MVQLTKLDGVINIYDLTVTGDAKIIDDQLDGK